MLACSNARLNNTVTDFVNACRPYTGRVRATVIIAGSLVLGAACSSGASCPTDLPTCPDGGAPSWTNDVQPIVQAQCASCHSPGGVEPAQPLVTYGDVYARRGPVLDQVYACLMPQTGSLSATDRNALLTWLECGAPNN